METVITCPLGSQCEEIKDNKLHRCAWFVKMRGQDATGKEHDKWDCSIAWQPLLQVEQSQSSRHVAASVQSLRNETIIRQDAAITAIKGELDASSIETKKLRA